MATLFVGDVHGCPDELRDLLRTVGFRRNRDRLLLTGDAFARGPDPVGVWDLIRAHRAEMVLGNHDARLLERLRCRERGEPLVFRREDHRRTFTALEPVAADLLQWLERVPLFIREPDFTLVHAGIHPRLGLCGTTRDQFLTIRLWPPAKGVTGPRWHAAYVLTERLLIFGHDAPGGLVVRRHPDGTPYLVGLDTGCVYGNQLTGYLLEENRIAQVPCRRPGGYWKVSAG